MDEDDELYNENDIYNPEELYDPEDSNYSVGQDYENTERRVAQGMKNTAKSAGNLAGKGADYAKQKVQRFAGEKAKNLRAVRKAQAVKRELQRGKRRTIKGSRNLTKGAVQAKAGQALRQQGMQVANAGKAMDRSGIGAIAGAALAAAGASMMAGGSAMENAGNRNMQRGKAQLLEGMNRIKRAPFADPDKPSESESSDLGDEDNPKIKAAPNAGRVIRDTIKNQLAKLGNIFKLFLRKYWFIILIPLFFLILFVIFTASSKKDRGKYVEGDNSNVPYVVKSQIFDAVTIVDNGKGKFVYGFKDDEGNILTLDEAIDNVLTTLRENDADSALDDLGKNDVERKKMIKAMVMAEFATQYPDLTKSQTGVVEYDDDVYRGEGVTSVEQLSLDEKIYQMIMLGVSVRNPSKYADSEVGGFFLFGGSSYENLDEIGSEYKVKPFIATDDEGGQVTRAAPDTESAKYYGDNELYEDLRNDEISKSKYLLSKGINLNLSPVSDVSASGTMYTLERSYSSNPSIVKECIKTVLEARNSASVDGVTLSSTLKHYPGYPDNRTNTDNGTVIDKRTEAELNPNIDVFKYGISNGAQSVMVSNVIYTSLDAHNPASLSPTIISSLRNGFYGVIMTDDLDAAATRDYPNRYKDAIKAGNDIILLDEVNLNIAFRQIKEAVEYGEISEAQIDQSVQRILDWKKSAGITTENTTNTETDTEKAEKFKGDINGNIKMTRKDENANVTDLTYVDEQAFNKLLSENDSRAFDYYTLKKGQATSSNSTSGGVKLEGSDVATQVWNFLVNDMGYSEAVAAGLMGNFMRECAGDTLNLNPYAENTVNGGHYGIAQWNKRNNPEIVGKDLAGQLEYFAKWIQTGEFDQYAANYRPGFSYQEFLNMTDPGEAAAAYGAIMERFGAPYYSVGMTDEYVTRANNARNAYATLKGTTSSSGENTNSSNTNTSSSQISNGVTLTSNGNLEFLDCAVRAHKMVREEGFTYNNSGRSMPINSGDSARTIDCAAYVSMALDWYGKNDWDGYPWQLTDTTMITYGSQKLEKVFEGNAYNVSDIPDLESGDIITWQGHTQIFYGYNSSGTAVWLNCGGNDSIIRVEGTDAYSSVSTPITYVFRVPNGSGTNASNSQQMATSQSSLCLVVANKKDISTNVTDNYTYLYSYGIDTNSGARLNGYSQTNGAIGSRQVSSSGSTMYSATCVDYQSALKEYTLYFDFLWAILVESSGNRSLITDWAELGQNSNVIVTVYNDENISTTSSSKDLGTYTNSARQAGSSVAVYDAYSVNEVSTTVTKTLASKPTITYADTWLLKYRNEADTYSEYKTKSKEYKAERTDPDAREDNIIKRLQKERFVLNELYDGQYIVEEMLVDNKKVSFMIDIYSYVLQLAKGYERSKINVSMDEFLDTSVFDLSATVTNSTLKVLPYTSIDISDSERKMLYNAVERICSNYPDNDENKQRKKYVTSVILNRVLSSKFPNSVEEVLNQRGQFPNYSKDDATSIEYSESTMILVDNVIAAGDCAQYSVYVNTPEGAASLDWNNKYVEKFNDGAYSYFSTDEIIEELKRLEITVESGTTVPTATAERIVAWALKQVGNKNYSFNGKTYSSSNTSATLISAAYQEAGLTPVTGNPDQFTCDHKITFNSDGTVNYSSIPVGAIIVSKGMPGNNGHVCLYVGNGYVVEAGGKEITKVPINESLGAKGHSCEPFLGWGFAVADQDAGYEALVAKIGGTYADGITEGTNFAGWGNRSGDGIQYIYTTNGKSYKVYIQGSGPYSGLPYWSGTIQSSGCGITSTSIILTGYGHDVTPETIKNNGRCPDGNSMYRYIQEFENYGISAHMATNLKEEIINNLREGRPVLINVQHEVVVGSRGYKGHYMTLLGMNSNGQIYIGDPGCATNSGYYDQSQIFTGGIVNAIIIDS